VLQLGELEKAYWVGVFCFLVFWEIASIFEKIKWQAKLKTKNAKKNSSGFLGGFF
jgi:membrane protein CcdC involved in cytochrome C biogenesis